jgi:ssDNA-binding Zn-finger/Zn-ribbon topoisomerase 1
MEAGSVVGPDVLESDLIEGSDRVDSFEERAELNEAPDRGGYVCPQCGHTLRVFGGGRHRVYFEPTNTALDDPIMNGKCPECGLGLPGKQ